MQRAGTNSRARLAMGSIELGSRAVAALALHALMFTFAILAPLSAEEVPMKNGSVLKGEVLSPIEDPVKIRTDHGVVLAPRKEIDKAWLAAKNLATPAEPDTPASVEPLPAEARIQILEAKIATLEATIAALRAELKMAEMAKAVPRKDAAEKAAQSLALTAPVSPPPAPGGSSVPAPGGYWLSADSGIRHNRECRYYMKSKGQPCLQNEGKPCSKCGG